MDVSRESAVGREARELSSDLTAHSPEIGQLAEWDQHLSLIAREAADLQRELLRLREESEVMARLLEQREAELAEMDACVSQLTTDRDREKDEMSEVRASLADAHADLEQSRERVQSLEQLLERGGAEHVESENALSRLRVELERAQRENAQAETSRLDLERSLEASRESVTVLEHELRLLTSRVVEPEELETRNPQMPPQSRCHLRLVARPTGYELSESAEPPPKVGELIEIDGRQYAVLRIGRSPLPGDERSCVLLLVEPTRTVPPHSLDAVEPPADALVSL